MGSFPPGKDISNKDLLKNVGLESCIGLLFYTMVKTCLSTQHWQNRGTVFQLAHCVGTYPACINLFSHRFISRV